MDSTAGTRPRPDRILSSRQVREIVGVSTSTLWRWQRAGKFPLRRLLNDHRVGWLESEIAEWIAARPRADG